MNSRMTADLRPHATATNTVVAVAEIRWRIEKCNESGKDLIGLDQQSEIWTAFHHHVVACISRLRRHPQGPPPEVAGPPEATPPTATDEGAHRENAPAPSPTRRRQRTTASGVS